jgi:hypothetical protein
VELLIEIRDLLHAQQGGGRVADGDGDPHAGTGGFRRAF